MEKKLFRNLAIDYKNIEDGKEDSRTIEFSFSSEKPAKKYGVGKKGKLIEYDEILSHETEENVDFSRIRTSGSLLFNHDANQVIGKIEDVYFDAAERKCRCRVTFDKDYESDKIFQKVKSGSIKGVSFGYMINNFERKTENKTELKN